MPFPTGSWSPTKPTPCPTPAIASGDHRPDGSVDRTKASGGSVGRGTLSAREPTGGRASGERPPSGRVVAGGRPPAATPRRAPRMSRAPAGDYMSPIHEASGSQVRLWKLRPTPPSTAISCAPGGRCSSRPPTTRPSTSADSRSPPPRVSHGAPGESASNHRDVDFPRHFRRSCRSAGPLSPTVGRCCPTVS